MAKEIPPEALSRATSFDYMGSFASFPISLLLAGALADAVGVEEVHDLHIWTITSGRESLSGHVVTDHVADTRTLGVERGRCLGAGDRGGGGSGDHDDGGQHRGQAARENIHPVLLLSGDRPGGRKGAIVASKAGGGNARA